MQKFFKWLGLVVGVLLGLLLITLAFFYVKGNTLLNQRYTIVPENIIIPTDVALIERGWRLAQAVCVDCHTTDLSGQVLMEAPFATINSANLTSGKGGAGAEFTDADWVRVLRHGMDNVGRGLVLMPAQEFWNYNDQDLGEIIAYLKSLPAVDKSHDDPQINILGKIMIGAGLFGEDFIPVNVIAHNRRPPVQSAGVTAEYGAYLVSVSGCKACHGTQLAGGRSGKPGSIDAPNLTLGGELKDWRDADFINTIQTGVTVSGHALNPDQMPWKNIRNYSDDELRAIFLYLKTLPAMMTVRS